jgi:hypothetical protein
LLDQGDHCAAPRFALPIEIRQGLNIYGKFMTRVKI